MNGTNTNHKERNMVNRTAYLEGLANSLNGELILSADPTVEDDEIRISDSISVQILGEAGHRSERVVAGSLSFALSVWNDTDESCLSYPETKAVTRLLQQIQEASQT